MPPTLSSLVMGVAMMRMTTIVKIVMKVMIVMGVTVVMVVMVVMVLVTRTRSISYLQTDCCHSCLAGDG